MNISLTRFKIPGNILEYKYDIYWKFQEVLKCQAVLKYCYFKKLFSEFLLFKFQPYINKIKRITLASRNRDIVFTHHNATKIIVKQIPSDQKVINQIKNE